MTLSAQEVEDTRQIVYQELAHIEAEISHCAGSYNYLCLVAGCPTFTHQPVGPVLRQIHHPTSRDI